MEDAAMLSPRTGRLGVLWIFGDYKHERENQNPLGLG